MTETTPNPTPNPTQATAPTVPARRWPKVLLTLSLMANLAVVGVIAGAHVRDDRDDRRLPPTDRSAMRDIGIGPLIDAMPREARSRAGDQLRARGNGWRMDRGALEAEFNQMVDVLKAEPYDPAALEALLAAQHARVTARVEAGRAILLEQIAAMDAEERALFADRLTRGFGRHGMERGFERGGGKREHN